MSSTLTSPPLSGLLADAEALLIDFHGTLSDDEDLLAELVAEIASEELGMPLDRTRYFEEFAGHTEEFMFRMLAGLVSDARIDALVGEFNQRYLRRTRKQSTISIPSREFVAEAHARGKALAVVTAASKDIVVPALNQVDLLDEIELVLSLEDVSQSKPDPEGYLRALELLDVAPDRAVAFEDSHAGLTAATGAGLTPVLVRGTLAEGPVSGFTPYDVEELSPRLFR